MKNLKQVLGAAIIFSFLYGLLTVVSQAMVRGVIQPLYLTFVVNFLAAAFLVFWGVFFNRQLFAINSKEGLKLGILSGIFGVVFGDLVILLGLQSSSSINWGILSRLSVPITFLLSAFFFKEIFSRFKTASVVVSLLGAFLVIYRPQNLSLNPGDVLFLLAVLGFSFSNIVSQKALQTIWPSQLMFLRIASGAVIMAVPVFFFPPQNGIMPWPFIIFNVFVLILGLWLINFIIKKAGASFFAIASNLTPVFTAGFAIVLLKEELLLWQVLGGLLIILSIVLFQMHKKKQLKVEF